jgi:hypothetical protein
MTKAINASAMPDSTSSPPQTETTRRVQYPHPLPEVEPMPSPFPGMNPYLERAGVWEMFHTQFLSTLQQKLTAQVRPRYRVKLDMRVLVHEPEGERRVIGEPDLKVRYLGIYDPAGQELITSIELLSPSNKYAGPDRESYLAKRRELLRSTGHFVELDLLRGGHRVPATAIPPCDYCAVVSRVEERPRTGVWPWKLREPIPKIPVPLRSPDPDASIDVKLVLDEVYDAGGYSDHIYNGLPEPRLSAEDAAWAAGFVPVTT